MSAWLVKIQSRGVGPDILVFRANLEDRLKTLPVECQASAVFTIDQVDATCFVFADSFSEAVGQAEGLITILEVPNHDVALAVAYLGEPALPPDMG